ncbi:hypothetical protein N0V82_004092 [Gnomoniopsis sp. IMI 355080]|nr:hypothetical protein N0V82_004092 [Gnomoniopsis sp. IMI 355080]
MTSPQSSPAWELQQRTHAVDAQSAEWPLSPTRRQQSFEIESANTSSVGLANHSEAWTPKEQAVSNDSLSTRDGTPRSPNLNSPRWPFEEPEQKPATDPRQQLPQRPVQPAVRPKLSHSRHVLKYWCLEILTVIVAVLLLVAIISLLSYYDGRYMPEWPFDINLNSAIAFLSTFLRAAIVAAVAEIIGQIKWTWFTERTRPLHHLQDFDSASRSILGSIRLVLVVIWNCGFTSAGLLGISAALVTIVSLAVGPVTQQAVRTAACPLRLPDVRSAIPAANYVPGSSSYYRVGAGSYELEVDMKSAMLKGLTEQAGSDNNGVDITCKTGNCSWPDYGTGVTHASIGLCSSCLDTTDFVSPSGFGPNVTLPDEGAYVNYGMSGQYMWVGYSNLSAYASLFSEDFATAAAVSVSNFSILAASTSPCTTDADTGKLTCPHDISQSSNTSYQYQANGDYIAASCVLYPCMKEYWARYEDNVLTERLVKSTTAIPNTYETTDDYSFYYNYTATKSPCVLDNGTWYNYGNQSDAAHIPGRTWANISLSDQLRGSRNISVPNECLYKMDGIFFYAISSFMSTLFDGQCIYDSEQMGQLNCGDSWWLTPLWGEMNATFTSIDTAITDFATAATNKLRMTGRGPDQVLGGKVDPAEAYGSVYETSTCTYFDRKWIILPAALVFICIVLLVWISIKNYRDPEQPVWKGSVLPLMFFGLQGAGTVSSNSWVREQPHKDRLERNATFFKEDGRAAPELDRIQNEAGKLWVRFHGGTDPGFIDLGAIGGRNNVLHADAEASSMALVPGNGSSHL